MSNGKWLVGAFALFAYIGLMALWALQSAKVWGPSDFTFAFCFIALIIGFVWIATVIVQAAGHNRA